MDSEAIAVILFFLFTLLIIIACSEAYLIWAKRRAKREHGDNVEPKDYLPRIAVRILDWAEESKRKNAAAKEKRRAASMSRSRDSASSNRRKPTSTYKRANKCSAFSANGRSEKHSGKCDGDCKNCPPHYGYRYGRWYYGHSHTEGCEFGGNKCDGGRD